MPSTYEPIATTTLGSNTQGLIFNNIPQTYTDLVLVFKGNITQAYWDVVMRFNNNSSNYSNIGLAAVNTTVDYAKNSTVTGIQIGMVSGFSASGLYAIGHTNIYNYTNTNVNKIVSTTQTFPEYANGISIGTWADTSAITSIYLYSRGSGSVVGFDLLAGTQITLYGIKAA
jgi:hypothetical protein